MNAVFCAHVCLVKYYVQGNNDSKMTGFSSKNSGGQKRMEQSPGRTFSPNSISRKNIFQKERQNKDISDKWKLIICPQQTCTTRNAEGFFLG